MGSENWSGCEWNISLNRVDGSGARVGVLEAGVGGQKLAPSSDFPPIFTSLFWPYATPTISILRLFASSSFHVARSVVVLRSFYVAGRGNDLVWCGHLILRVSYFSVNFSLS